MTPPVNPTDRAYAERNMLVGMLSKLFPSWIGHDPNEPDWPVVLIQLPTGQVSWHVTKLERFSVFPHVEDKPAPQWDGHDDAEKWRRVCTFTPLSDDAFGRVLANARAEGEAAGYSRCRGEHAMPTGDETQGFEAGHRLAAVIALSELHRACVLPDIDNDTFDGHLVPYVAQFISNWERRGEAAGYERGVEAVLKWLEDHGHSIDGWGYIQDDVRKALLAAAPPKPEVPKKGTE